MASPDLNFGEGRNEEGGGLTLPYHARVAAIARSRTTWGHTEGAAAGPVRMSIRPHRITRDEGRHLRQHRQHRRWLQGLARSRLC
jgi:hypothetical protein